jgi:DNA-binding FrmR family transcriptional regulator
MYLDREATEPVVNQIRRAERRLSGVVRMLENGRECGDVVAELAAVCRGLDRAGFALLTCSLGQSIAADGRDGRDGAETRKLERLFLSLA